MRVIRNIFKRWHVYITWALLSTIFMGWIFTFLTDTTPAHKITMYIHAYTLEDQALSMKLEEALPEGIRMVKVHSFDYALFGQTGFVDADMFLISASEIESYLTDFMSLEECAEKHPELTYYYDEGGVPCGIRVYDSETEEGIAMTYITYKIPEALGRAPEDYYLFFGKEGFHNGLDDQDEAAFEMAENFMGLE